MRVRRFDFASLSAPVRRQDGTLVAEAVLTRTGVFVYRNPDGSERREYRPPQQVFSPESLASFKLVPITDDHPPEMITAENARRYAVGTVGENIRKDGAHVVATIAVHDAATIAKMDAGKRAVSCGYDCDLVNEPGVSPTGERYDAVQTNIVGNHLALVHNARAGAAAAVRMDAAHIVSPGDDAEQKDQAMTLEQALAALADTQQKLGAEKSRADAAEKLSADHKSRADKLEGERDELKARADAAEKARKDADDKLPALVRARVELETKAGAVMGKEFKVDGLSDRDIRLAVIEKVAGVKVAAEKSDDYVTARFDAAVERAGAASEAFKGAQAVIEHNRRVDAQVTDKAIEARNAMAKRYAEMNNINAAPSASK